LCQRRDLLVERKNRRAVSKEHGNSIRLQFSRSATGWRRSTPIPIEQKATKETKIFLWNGFDLNLGSLGYLLLKFFEGINPRIFSACAAGPAEIDLSSNLASCFVFDLSVVHLHPLIAPHIITKFLA
jgi:hypothetical protein